MNGFSIAILAATAFALSAILTDMLRRFAIKSSMVDSPDERTSHDGNVPRGGGMSFVAVWSVSILIGWLADIVPGNIAMTFLLPSLIVALTGFADDLGGLRNRIRFALHIFAAGIFLYYLGGWPSLNLGAFNVEWGILGIFFAAFGIVGSVNFFNFMDGIDSIASVEGVFVLGGGGLMIYRSGGETIGLMAILLAVCILGFLVWNIPPATVFMGDGGSGFIGFLIAAFALYGEIFYNVPLLAWAILYGVFWFDSTVTLLRRIARGEKWHAPHKLHAYQRLHQSGWTHGKVVLGVCAINATLGVLAYEAFLNRSFTLYLFGASVFILALVYVAVERKKAF